MSNVIELRPVRLEPVEELAVPVSLTDPELLHVLRGLKRLQQTARGREAYELARLELKVRAAQCDIVSGILNGPDGAA